MNQFDEMNFHHHLQCQPTERSHSASLTAADMNKTDDLFTLHSEC